MLGFDVHEPFSRRSRSQAGADARDGDREAQTGGENHCPLDHIAELTNVAGPAVGLKSGHVGVRDGVDPLAKSFRELLDEVPDQRWDVFDTLAQGRYSN